MGSYNAEDCGQTEARPFPDRLCREERFENAGQNLCIHAIAGIGESETNEITITLFGIHRRWSPMDRLERSGDTKFSTVWHRVACIDREVHRNLIHHAGISVDRRKARLWLKFNLHMLAHETFEHLDRIVQRVIQIK